MTEKIGIYTLTLGNGSITVTRPSKSSLSGTDTVKVIDLTGNKPQAVQFKEIVAKYKAKQIANIAKS